ncbi:unnamed protein product [Larinioides sclopetarius]|uniref:Cuticle protein n=1 Tax=Larinioides sclopetarius TaxID=280406 RepID=A0AAV2C0I7_9ARAC
MHSRQQTIEAPNNIVQSRLIPVVQSQAAYGYVDPFGMYRRVEYVADVDGYRATVHSNEPGMTSNGAANAAYFVEVPPPAIVAQGLAYLKPVQED